MKRTIALAVVASGLAVTFPALAAPVLQETLFNLNGTTYHNTFVVPGLDAASFDGTTGLGTLTLTFSPGAAGAYYLVAFFDHQLHVPFYNEYGAVIGVPGAGVSWQIDEPGFGDGNRLGTIFDHAIANALDNTNHVPGTLSNFFNDCGGNTPGQPPNPACNNDVSLALGFNFILAADELVTITLIASGVAPGGGFYLQQHDPDSPSDLFLAGSIAIGRVSVPEPGTLLLLGSAIAAFAVASLSTRLRGRSRAPVRRTIGR